MTDFFVELPDPWVETMEAFSSNKDLPSTQEALAHLVEGSAALLLANDILRAGMDSYATCIRGLIDKYCLGQIAGVDAVLVDQIVEDLAEIVAKHE